MRPTFILLLLLASSARGQDITVRADAPQHRFDGAGTSFGLFLGHHYSMPDAGEDEAVRWIAQDLSLSFIQDYPDGETEPADNPTYYDRRADYVKAVRAYRPGAVFSLATNKYPSRLRTEITVNGREYLVLDVEREGIYQEVADWYFSLFQAFHDRGAPVQILNVVNEPDLNVCAPNDPLQCRPYHYGYGDDTERGVAEVFAQAVPAFLAMFDDPLLNASGMEAPRIMGPSSFSPDGGLRFVRYMKQNRPEAWDAVDIVAVHQYQNGVRGDLFQALRNEAEGKPLWQSETHGSKQFASGAISPGLRTALSTAQLIGASVNFGTEMWAYFQANYPNPAGASFDQFNPGGLLSVPFNTTAPERYTHYYAFRQLTSTQPDSSFVLDYAASAGRRADVLAFGKPGVDTVYVHVTNTGGGTKSITLRVTDASGTRELRGYARRVTDSIHRDEETETGDLGGAAEWATTLGPYSIHTFALGLGVTVDSEPGPLAAEPVLLAPRPNPAAGRATLAFHLAEAAEVRLSVLDALGREVATLARGPHAAGRHDVAWEPAGLASGVYTAVLRAGGAVQARRLVLAR